MKAGTFIQCEINSLSALQAIGTESRMAYGSVLLFIGLQLAVNLSLLSCQESGLGSGAGDLEEVWIDSITGDDERCVRDGFLTACRSLEQVAAVTANHTGSLTVYINAFRPLPLQKTVFFQHLSEVRLIGWNSCIDCNWDSVRFPGIVFQFVDNVIVQGLNITSCGVEQKYPHILSEDPAVAAIHLYSCSNVTITNTTVSHSNGAGLFISNMTGGYVHVSDSAFSYNTNPAFKYFGGNGVYLHIENGTRPLSVQFDHCSFMSNVASAPQEFNFLNGYRKVIKGSGGGGGLSIIGRGTSRETSIMIVHCQFTNNTAFLGAGLQVSLKRTNHFSLLLKWSNFDCNGCSKRDSGGSGGGISIGAYDIHGEAQNQNLFQIELVNVTSNCAEIGGGANFHFGKSHVANSNVLKVLNSSWIKNTARIGAAIDISSYNGDKLRTGYLPVVEFINCNFSSNTIISQRRDSQYEVGMGVLFSSGVDLIFSSEAHFTNNNGTALLVSNAIANFSSSNASFCHNTAFQGGGIALIGTSFLLVGSEQSYRFIGNSARDSGGAIYVEVSDIHYIILTKTCFLQYLPVDGQLLSLNHTVVHFEDNAAANAGPSIYATSLVPCTFQPLLQRQSIGNLLEWVNTFNYSGNGEIELEIATDGSQFLITEPEPLQIIPGERYRLPLRVLDDLNHSISSIYPVSVWQYYNDVIQLDNDYSNGVITLKGKPGSNGTLILETISAKKLSVKVCVVLVLCPPGFSISNGTCECMASRYVGLEGCCNFQANISVGFWSGYIIQHGTETFVTGICPTGFCQYGFNTMPDSGIQLPRRSSDLDTIICGSKRTGVLCGNCRDGYAVHFNSPRYSCFKADLCKFGPFFYLLAEIVPITALFITVIIFNINFTSGRIHGFILFTQLLDTISVDGSGTIFTPAAGAASWVYRLIYGVFSLNFFSIEPLSFCIFPRGSALDVMALKFVSVSYAFLLIVMVVVYLRYCGYRLGRYIRITTIRSSVIHGLATFIIVSYVQCVKVSLNILLPHTLRAEGAVSVFPRRVLFNGDTIQFSKEHLPYAIPAIVFFTVFGLLLPVILILYPAVNPLVLRCCPSRASASLVHVLKGQLRFLFPSKLKPFLDSFQGYFKENCRFFAGVYFVYRWIFILVSLISPSLARFYFAVIILQALFLTLHSVMQPYRIKWHNYIDTLLFADLLIINATTACIYFYSRSTERSFNEHFIFILGYLQIVCIYLPLVYFVGLIITSIYLKCRVHITFEPSVKLKESLTNSLRTRKSDDNISLDEFPARLIGEYVDYEDNVSDSSRRASISKSELDDEPSNSSLDSTFNYS